MFKIVKAEQLSANVYKKVVLAPRVALLVSRDSSLS